MLNRILIILVVFLALTASFLYFRVNSLVEQNTSLKGEKNSFNEKIKDYENAIQKYNDAQNRAGEKIEKVRTIVRTVKSDCDCWHTLVDDRVRDEIRKRRNH